MEIIIYSYRENLNTILIFFSCEIFILEASGDTFMKGKLRYFHKLHGNYGS